MPVPSLITDLSTTAGSNSPAGSDNVFPDLDNYLRALSGFIASIRDNSGNGWVSPYLPLAGGTVTGNVNVPSLNTGQLTLSASGALTLSKTAVTAPAASDGNVFSGTYTPTLYTVGTNNVSAATATSCQYMRVGNTVTVSGRVLITPDVANTYTRLDLSLPISTTLINIGDLSGVSHVSTTAVSEIQSGGGAISAETTNSRATIAYAPTVASNRSIAFTFTYRVA